MRTRLDVPQLTFDLAKPLLGVIVRGEHVATWRQAGKSYSHKGPCGSFSFMNAPTHISAFREHSEADHLIVELDFGDFERWSGPDYPQNNLINYKGGVEKAISSLVLAMDAEVSNGCASGSLYAQSLSMALLSYIDQHFSLRTPVKVHNGLSQNKLRKIQDFIYDNLADDISLHDLAELAEISLNHFCRSFKKATGMSPYQYILNARIKKAKIHLSQSAYSIAEIALMVGFSSQSHFSDTFRRCLGTSPRQFRLNASPPMQLSRTRAARR